MKQILCTQHRNILPSPQHDHFDAGQTLCTFLNPNFDMSALQFPHNSDLDQN